MSHSNYILCTSNIKSSFYFYTIKINIFNTRLSFKSKAFPICMERPVRLTPPANAAVALFARACLLKTGHNLKGHH